MDQVKIGAFLKELRTEKGLTQLQLAEQLNTTNRSVSRWETGSTLPDISILVELARLYIINNKEIRQITRDHSLVEEMVRMGGLKRELARTHPDKNIITRAIGAQEDVDVDFFEVTLNKDDVILMCSDGLSNMIEDEEIRSVI